LAEAETVIAAGCIGHNQLYFYPDAMDVALEFGDLDEVERYAAALEAFTKPERLAYADFFITNTRRLRAPSRRSRFSAGTPARARGRAPTGVHPGAASDRIRACGLSHDPGEFQACDDGFKPRSGPSLQDARFDVAAQDDYETCFMATTGVGLNTSLVWGAGTGLDRNTRKAVRERARNINCNECQATIATVRDQQIAAKKLALPTRRPLPPLVQSFCLLHDRRRHRLGRLRQALPNGAPIPGARPWEPSMASISNAGDTSAAKSAA